MLLLSRWMNLSAGKRQELNQLFALNQKVFKVYLLKASKRVWTACGPTTAKAPC